MDGKLVNRGEGCLFHLSAEAKAAACERHYAISPPGWSTCPAGFAVYTVRLPILFGYRLVVPGLKVLGHSTAQGRSESLSIKTSAVDLERYVARALDGFDQAERFFQTLIERSVHEMRQINRDIVATIEDVADFLTKVPHSEYAVTRMNNMRALSEILASRSDFLDYLSGPPSSAPQMQVRPYQKFDKTIRSLRKRAADRSVALSFTGTSIGVILGLPVFEVIPYLLIENAIKFSPPQHSVLVTFVETDAHIAITVQNSGPAMTDDEIGRVFDIGFRGQRAIDNNIPGSGIGLFFLRDLVERHHNGTFKFQQRGDPEMVGSTPYRSTEILLRFKRYR
jgi:signal transduction histidine kinase